MKSIKIMCMSFGLYLSIVAYGWAMHVVDFHTYDLADLRYENRIRLSTRISDYDFETSEDHDVNMDGTYQYCETDTFFHEASQCSMYFANAHSRYSLSNVLVWIGLSESIQQMKINDTIITEQNCIPMSDSSILWPHESLKEIVNYVVLLDLEESIEPRLRDEPIASCNPYMLTFSDVYANDDSILMYATAFGAVKTSGFNSYSPSNSDVLFLAHSEKTQPIAPVPEPTSLFFLVVGCISIRKLYMRI